MMRFTWSLIVVCACSAVAWTDTFTATGTRTTEDAGSPPSDSGTSAQACATLAASKPAPKLTVTFPGHGVGAESIHIVAGAQSCDLQVDTDTDGIVFVSDATPCAALVAPGAPGQSTATVYGSTSPSGLLFQWSYSTICTIDDTYSLSKQ
ncbi:MAG TPA: hypothetical protein VGH87_08775 [Polyangiaceae bacterium]